MRNKKGFTLVELMVVVAVVGVLATVAVPIYSSVTKRAKEKICDTNRLLVESAVIAYLEVGNNGKPHTFTSAARSFGMENPPKEKEGASAGPFTEDVWTEDFKTNFKNEKLPRCPFDEENGKYAVTLHYRANTTPAVEVTCETEHENK